ncbi:pleckstrin homology domain-containing family B member 2-like [Clytia hemisphaerica]|uniref:PH domain-containing protein n=1 Tax=Clytia hemisphaerica TaxID=252671 RepID=A0A7M5WS95_9CNID
MASIRREGFLLKRDDSWMFPGWKKKHCQLKSDGVFAFGDGKHVEHHFNTKIDLKKVEQGFEAESLNLPKGRSDMESMFVVHLKHKKYYFLASNIGECLAWIGSIKNSQTATSSAVAPISHGATAPGYHAPSPHHHGQPHPQNHGQPYPQNYPVQHQPIHPQHQQPMHHQAPPFNPNYHH